MKVTLYQPHTHAGTRYVPGPKGLQVDLPADAVAWLRANTRALDNPMPAAPAPVVAPEARADSGE